LIEIQEKDGFYGDSKEICGISEVEDFSNHRGIVGYNEWTLVNINDVLLG